MLDRLIFEFHELMATNFWIVACLACAAAYLTKEMSGRFAYALASLPAFLAAGVLASCVMRVAEIQPGVDRITDTIVSAITGMMILIVCVLMAKKVAVADKV